MGYRKIENLYKSQTILMFKQCIALEKIHGTSVHVKYSVAQDRLIFFSGGSNHEQFVALFNKDKLLEAFRENAVNHPEDITIYGEAYGGKLQRMADTYGKELKFVAFEVKIKDKWLGVFEAEKLANQFGFEFVHYKVINATEEEINAEMMADSVQAVRNGMGTGHMREGVILRPLVEFLFPDGVGRIIVKHKRPEFAERKHTPKIEDPEQLKILARAEEISNEWVVMERLRHVLDALKSKGIVDDPSISDANKIIKEMISDIEIEAKGEIIESKEARKAIGKRTMKLFKEYMGNKDAR